jgi:RecB family exonuclease
MNNTPAAPIIDASTNTVAGLEYLSYSRVNRFMQCPRSFFFKYVAKLRHDVAYWLLEGVSVHKALEFYMNYRIQSHEEPPIDMVDDAYTSAFYGFLEGMEDEDEAIKDPTIGGVNWLGQSQEFVFDEGRFLVHTYIERQAPKVRPIVSEMAMNETIVTPNGTHKVIGRIDLIDERGVVIDFKTASRTPGKDKHFKDLQATFYALGVGLGSTPTNMDNLTSESSNDRVEAPIRRADFEFHYMVKSGPQLGQVIVVPTTRTTRDVEFLVREVLPPIIDSVTNGIFPCNTDHYLCNEKFCDFFSECVGRPLSIRIR